MNLNEYLIGRRKVIEETIAVEVLAGNTVKESNERTALVEITGLEDWLRNQDCQITPANSQSAPFKCACGRGGSEYMDDICYDCWYKH